MGASIGQSAQGRESRVKRHIQESKASAEHLCLAARAVLSSQRPPRVRGRRAGKHKPDPANPCRYTQAGSLRYADDGGAPTASRKTIRDAYPAPRRTIRDAYRAPRRTIRDTYPVLCGSGYIRMGESRCPFCAFCAFFLFRKQSIRNDWPTGGSCRAGATLRGTVCLVEVSYRILPLFGEGEEFCLTDLSGKSNRHSIPQQFTLPENRGRLR